MAQSPNIALPFIAASQAQKHVTHNDAVALLDTLVQLAVESASTATPPGGAPEGARYIVPTGATGAWSGHAGQIAQQEVGGWRLVTPTDGLRAWIRDQSVLAVRTGGDWTDFRSLLGKLSLDELGVNATASPTNRLAIASAASLFNQEGGSHRMAINKQSAADTASMIFQTGFSGRAEFGLAGSDQFAVKVSPDGSSWHNALDCDQTTGAVRLPAGVAAPGLPVRVLTAVLTTGFTTTATAAQATGLLVTITPRSTTSKLLVRCHLTVGGYFWSCSPLITVTRNGTKIWPSSAAAMSHQLLANGIASSRQHSYPASFEFLDSPATTSPVTYEVTLASSLSGTNVHLNLRDIDLAIRGESTMVVTEISG